MSLGIKICKIGDDPPSILVCGDVPYLVYIAKHNFLFDFFDILYGFIRCLSFHIVCNVLFTMWITLGAVSCQFLCGHWMQMDNASIVFIIFSVVFRHH